MRNNGFWRDFAQHADSLAKEVASGSEREALDSIDGLLKAHNLDLCFDITSDEDGYTLIFSPEGQASDAIIIDQLLKDAPDLANWKFWGRRQKKELEDAAAIVWNLYALNPLQMRFRLLNENSGQVVEMIIPSNSDLTPEESNGMINTFLWHAIGEARVIEQGMRGKVTFQDSPSTPTISAAQLLTCVG